MLKLITPAALAAVAAAPLLLLTTSTAAAEPTPATGTATSEVTVVDNTVNIRVTNNVGGEPLGCRAGLAIPGQSPRWAGGDAPKPTSAQFKALPRFTETIMVPSGRVHDFTFWNVPSGDYEAGWMCYRGVAPHLVAVGSWTRPGIQAAVSTEPIVPVTVTEPCGPFASLCGLITGSGFIRGS